MKGIKGLRLGLAGAAAAAALAGGLVLVMTAWAASGSISVTSASAPPDGSASVDVVSNVEDPGLGAWSMNITYDPDVIAVGDANGDGVVDQDDCTEGLHICNPNAGPDTVRLTGGDLGIEGEAVLNTIMFDCLGAEGTSDLTIEVEQFADGTVGDPQDVEPLTVEDGTFACETPPTATEEPPTEEPATEVPATEAPTALPDVGTGTSSTGGSNGLGWVIVALSAVGLAGIAGYGALRLRTR